MLGNSIPTSIAMSPDGWQVAYYEGRTQSYTVWLGKHSYHFDSDEREAHEWIARARERQGMKV